jgi:ABC-2 type transport system ATP-binding protein
VEATDRALVEVQHLHKRYRDTVAVEDVSLTVEAGEIVGIVGPNGAGKSITVELIQGLRAPDRGRVRVLGLDPWRDRDELRQRVGAQLQQSDLYDKVRVGEALELFANPEVAILDELSTGLDPHARRDTWRLIEQSGPAGSRWCWSATTWRRSAPL